MKSNKDIWQHGTLVLQSMEAWANWAGKADKNILESLEFDPRVFLDKCQVDRFNKVTGPNLVLVKKEI